MVAEYGDYVYNQRLFHLHDDGIIDERELMWDYASQMRQELGSCQTRVRGRTAMLFFCGLILFALGCAAIGVNFISDGYPGNPRPAYVTRPVYATAVLAATGTALCLGALVLFAAAGNKIIFYERGFQYVTLFGLCRQTVMYRDIRYIAKHRVHTTKCAFDSYMIHTDRKKYNWTADNYIGAAEITDLLLFKCFQNVSSDEERSQRLNQHIF